MLLRVIFENFLSFNDSVQFDLFPNPKRTYLSSHIYEESVPVLKLSAIYGNVGAGKTNIIKGLQFLRNFVLNKNFLDKERIKPFFFKLKPDAGKSPLSVKIEFENNGRYFFYEVQISESGVEKESLYESGLGEKDNILIFRRNQTELIQKKTPQADLQKAVFSLMEKNKYSSVLAMNKDFPFLADSICADTAFEWFKERLMIVRLYSKPLALINKLYKDKAFLEFTNNTIRDIHLGIERLNVEFSTLDDFVSQGKIDIDKIPSKLLKNLSEDSGISKEQDNRPQYDIILEDGIQKIGEMIFHQIGVNGFVGEMDVLSQSDGTLRLLTLMPAFYAIFNKKCTVFIDEINNCIHPNLIKELVRNYSESASKGQLIYTTHESELLDNDFMRADEVWIANKVEGSTDLYSINDFKEHRGLLMRRGYLEGRYGGVPYTTLKKFSKDELLQENEE